jgi:sugar lactone lactonase YvrE
MLKKLLKKIKKKKINKRLIYIILGLIVFLVVSFGTYLLLKPKPNDLIKESKSGLFENINPNFKVVFGDKTNISKQYVRFESVIEDDNPFEEAQEEGSRWDRMKDNLFPTQKGFEMTLSAIKWNGTDDERMESIEAIASNLELEKVETSTEVIEVGRVIGEKETEEPISKPTVLNQDVFPGIDVEYQILEGLGVKEEIVIRSMEEYTSSCDNGECLLPLNQFDFDLKLDEGLYIKESIAVVRNRTETKYYITDSEGRYLAHFLPTFAVDGSNAKTTDVKMYVEHIEGNNYKVSVILNPYWLFSSERTFPIRIDPSIVHDTTTEFDTGYNYNTEVVTGPKVQLNEPDLSALDSYIEGYWKFDEINGTGAFLVDSSGNGNHATPTGTAYFYGKVDGARNFVGGDTTGEYISAGTSTTLKPTSALTVSAWVFSESENLVEGRTVLSTYDYVSSTESYGYNFGALYYDGTFGFHICDGGNVRDHMVEDFDFFQSNLRQWTHMVGVYSGSNYIRLYKNGVLVDEETTGVPSSIVYNGGSFIIGRRALDAQSYFDGSLDEIRVYSTALTASQVQDLYRVGAPETGGAHTSASLDMTTTADIESIAWTPVGNNTGDGETPYSTTGLVGQWDFNETSGTTADNEGSCGASCDGTLYGMTTTGRDVVAESGWTSDNRRWGTGALMFDGTNDYVSAANNSLYDFERTEAFTLEAWFKSTGRVGSTETQTIIGKMSNSSPYRGYDISFYNGVLRFLIINTYDTNCIELYGGYVRVDDGKWHHVVATYDGSSSASGAKIYLDGEIYRTTAYRNNLTSTIVATTPVTIGSRTGGAYFEGIVDSARIYSRELSASEIASNYQSGNIEMRYRTSTDGSTWSSWSGRETIIEDFDYDYLYSMSNPMDLSYASYASKYFSVDSQEGIPDGLKFSSDGSKMYVIGDSNNTVYQYTLSTAWDVSTASYASKSFSVASQETEPGKLAFSLDGSKMYVIGHINDTVYQYALSTAWDVSTASYASKSFPVTTQTTYPSGLAFSSSGAKMYVVDYTSGNVYQYTLSTAWDISTASYSSKVSHLVAYTEDIAFSPDGTKIFALETVSYDNVYQYALSTAWDVSSASYASKSFSVVSEENSADGLTFSSDGSKMYVVGFSNKTVYQYTFDDTNLVSYWPMDESSGTTVEDIKGSNDGTASGTSVVEGKFGNARMFNGVNEYIEVTNDSSLQLTSQFSFGAWIYRRRDTGNWERIMSKSDTSGLDYYMQIASDDTLHCGNHNSSATNNSRRSSDIINLGKWIYVVCTMDSSYNWHVYLDGVLNDGLQEGSRVTANTSTRNLQFGRLGSASTWYYTFQGQIDEFTLYNTQLSASEIYSNWRKGSNDPEQIRTNAIDRFIEGDGALEIDSEKKILEYGTQGYWTLDEPSGTGAYILDSSDKANHATPSGTTFVKNGYIGGARYFDGTDDYISTADIDYGTNNEISIEVWFNYTECNGSDGVCYLVSKHQYGSSSPNQLNVNSVGNVTFRVTNVALTAAHDYMDGGWHYAVATVEGTTAKLYVDGFKEDEATVTTTTNNEITIIGGDDASPTYRPFKGYIDDVRITAKALKPIEIGRIYSNGRGNHVKVDIESRDLSSQSILPFWIASDQKGNNLDFIYGESDYANYEADENTVGLWHLDEEFNVSGVYYLLDSSGNDYLGDADGSVYYSPPADGPLGLCRHFDGVDGTISMGNVLGFERTDAFTLEAWVKTTSPTSSTIMGKMNNASPYKGYGMIMYTDGRIFFQLINTYSTNALEVRGTTSVNDGTWHHVAVTYDGSSDDSGVKIYIDGVADATTTQYDSLSASITNTNNFRIGAKDNGNFFPGHIDEGRVSDVVRTPDEIRQAYEVNKRTHPIKINFKAELQSGNLITGSTDYSFSIDERDYGGSTYIENIDVGQKIVVKEYSGSTEYIAQGDVTSVNSSTGAITVSSWDTGSTFPSGGYTTNAIVYKWQREYVDIRYPLSEDIRAVTSVLFKKTNRMPVKFWIDDFRMASYSSDYTASSFTPIEGVRYIQYESIFTRWDGDAENDLYLSEVDISYSVGPTMDQLMRHGKWFDSSGVEQPFWWAN